MLILLELQLQRVTGNNQLGLPYWDWASDGDLPTAQQPAAPLWTAQGIGGTGNPITSGPFAPNAFRVRIESDATGRLRAIDKGLARNLAGDLATLPTTSDMTQVLNQTIYDAAPWERSTRRLRNRLEGWYPSGIRMHNRIHVWVGGDMGPASSPNDPVFYLNHCNVDRLWEGWMTRRGRTYVPAQSAPAALAGHRVDDPLYSVLVNKTVTPAQMLDARSSYSYDHVP
jgi:tyrosinase